MKVYIVREVRNEIADEKQAGKILVRSGVLPPFTEKYSANQPTG